MATYVDLDKLMTWLEAKETAHIARYGFPVGDDDNYSEGKRAIERVRNYARAAGLLDAVAVELPVAVPALRKAA